MQFFTGSLNTIRSNYSLAVMVVFLQQQHLGGLFLPAPTDQEQNSPRVLMDFHWAASTEENSSLELESDSWGQLVARGRRPSGVDGLADKD